jgi:hypothetical protein
MSSNNDSGSKLIDWYRKHIRPFFVTYNEGKVAEFDADCDRIKAIHHALDQKLPVCLLGASGIGKSTLINALVFGEATHIPSGGIGPLTAQALSVCHDPSASFDVLYHGPDRVNRLIFGLERHLQAEAKRLMKGASAEEPPQPETLGLVLISDEEAKELNELVSADDTDRDRTICSR